MAYSKQFILWSEYFAGGPIDSVVLDQWFRYESYGESPAEPCSGFISLLHGKRVYTSTENTLRGYYFDLPVEWQGFASYVDLFPRFVFESIFSWRDGIRDIAESLYD